MRTKELFNLLNQNIKNFQELNAEDLIPHQVLSHGFMEWLIILGEEFPSLYRSLHEQKHHGKNGIKREEDCTRFLYERFFIEIAKLSSLSKLTKEEMKELKEEGFKEFLED